MFQFANSIPYNPEAEQQIINGLNHECELKKHFNLSENEIIYFAMKGAIDLNKKEHLIYISIFAMKNPLLMQHLEKILKGEELRN